MNKLKKISQGAEAILYLDEIDKTKIKENPLETSEIENWFRTKKIQNIKVIIKERIKKNYRHEFIDYKLRKQRTKTEFKIMNFLRNNNINVPFVFNIDLNNYSITMEYINGKKLSELKLKKEYIEDFAEQLAKIHDLGIAHGDPTTSNIIIKDNYVYIIDFGLSFYTKKIEDFAVDIHLFRQALESRHFDQYNEAFKWFIDKYKETKKDSENIIKRFNVVEERGRYKHKSKKIINNS